LKYDGVDAGLPRELGILIAAVIRARLGAGEGMRGREYCSWNNDMVVVEVGVLVEAAVLVVVVVVRVMVVVALNGQAKRRAGSE
jgi:hypothetical protein